MFCAISGKVPEEPVVSKKTGQLYEKRLITKYIEEEGKCPVSDEDLTQDDLVEVKTALTMVKPRTLTAMSIPGLLTLMQNEWDDLMLETFTLKKHLDATRQELSQALYQHDAACRVIARLMKERDDALAKKCLGIQHANGSATDDMKIDNMIPEAVVEEIVQKSTELSTARKKRSKPDYLATNAQVAKYVVQSSHTIHKSDKPGITCVDVHPIHQNRVLTGGMDREVKLFDRSSGQIISTLKGHGKKISAVQFHPTADILFTCSHDNTAKVWSGSNESYTLTHTLSCHTAPVSGCSVHVTGDYVATSSEDGTWGFHDLRSGRCMKRAGIAGEDTSLECLSFHPDGVILGTGTVDNVVKIWDMKTQQNVASFQGHRDKVNSIDFSENGYHMASAASDGCVMLWDLRKLKTFFDFVVEGKNVKINEVVFDHSGSYLGVASSAGVGVYQEAGKRKWELVKTWEDHKSAVTGVKLAKDVSFLVSCSMDRSMKFYG